MTSETSYHDTEGDYRGDNPNGWGWSGDTLVWRSETVATVTVHLTAGDPYGFGDVGYWVAVVETGEYFCLPTLDAAINWARGYLI